MTYSVHSGVYEAKTATFRNFPEALRYYRFRRAYQLTLPKGHWYSVSMTNDDLIDPERATGLTDEQWEEVLDDRFARSLLNEHKPDRFFGLVCGHAVADLGQPDNGIRIRKCLVCEFSCKEYHHVPDQLRPSAPAAPNC